MDFLSPILASPGALNFEQWIDYSMRISTSPFWHELAHFERVLYDTQDDIDDVYTSFKVDEALEFSNVGDCIYEDAFNLLADDDDRFERIDRIVREIEFDDPWRDRVGILQEGMASLSTLWFDFMDYVFTDPSTILWDAEHAENPLAPIPANYLNFHPYELHAWRYMRREEMLGWFRHMNRVRQVLKELVKKTGTLEFKALMALPEEVELPNHLRFLESHIYRLLRRPENTLSLSRFWTELGFDLNIEAYGPGY